jgi:hypothetical protein
MGALASDPPMPIKERVESTRRSSDSTDAGTGDQNGDSATKVLAKTVSWVDVVLVKGVMNQIKTVIVTYKH